MSNFGHFCIGGGGGGQILAIFCIGGGGKFGHFCIGVSKREYFLYRGARKCNLLYRGSRKCNFLFRGVIFVCIGGFLYGGQMLAFFV